MAAQIPRQFGKCRVARRLGSGATAVVFLARHEGLEIPVAVKVLRRKLSKQKPQYAERFLREARMAAWLEHPNIVRVIDCGVENDYHYMVMDYVDGPNCLELIEQNPEGLDWQEAVDIVHQTTEGLAYAAGRDVIHRDVKPSNLMIDSSGRVRVTDLGLAKLTIKGMASLTQDLRTVGTPNYMSPEQIRSPSDLDLRTDVYGLGASLYHMVCGRTPYSGHTSMAVIAQHLSAPLVPPIRRKPELPGALSDIICKMMAKMPRERYQDYEELQADLENLVEGRKTVAEGFEASQTAVEDEAELRELLDELDFGEELEIEGPEKTPGGRARSGTPAREAGTSDIAPFGAGEFASYGFGGQGHDGGSPYVTTTRHWPLIVGLVMAGLIILAALVVLFLLLTS